MTLVLCVAYAVGSHANFRREGGSSEFLRCASRVLPCLTGRTLLAVLSPSEQAVSAVLQQPAIVIAKPQVRVSSMPSVFVGQAEGVVNCVFTYGIPKPASGVLTSPSRHLSMACLIPW